MAAVARQEGYSRIFVPQADAAEAALIPGLEVIPVTSLAQLYAHLSGSAIIRPHPPIAIQDVEAVVTTDLAISKARSMSSAHWKSRPPGCIT